MILTRRDLFLHFASLDLILGRGASTFSAACDEYISARRALRAAYDGARDAFGTGNQAGAISAYDDAVHSCENMAERVIELWSADSSIEGESESEPFGTSTPLDAVNAAARILAAGGDS